MKKIKFKEIPDSNSETNVKKESAVTTIKQFIDSLKFLVGEENLFIKDLKAHFGGEKVERTVFTYPLYQRYQVSNACLSLLNDESLCKIVKMCRYDYSRDSEKTPYYETIEIRRTELKKLLIEGYIFAYFKKIPILLYFNFCNPSSEISFCFKKENEKEVNEFISLLQKERTKNNYYRGEKIGFNSDGEIYFVNLEKLEWEDISIPDVVKKEIWKHIIFPISHRDEYKKFNLPWKRGLLLTGVPGTGKSTICKILTTNLPCTVIWASARNFEFGGNFFAAVYDTARELSPSLVIIEDIDLIGSDREFSPTSILGELLTQLDGLSPNEGVFTVATTNRQGKLDEALINRPARFDKVLKINPPDTECRKIIISKMIKEGDAISQEFMTNLIKRVEGYTGAHIKELIINARKISFLEKKKGYLDEDMLLKSFKEIQEGFKHYKKQNDEFYG